MAVPVSHDGNIYTLHRIDPDNIDVKKFDEIYSLYEKCYPLASERVPKEDFIGYLKAGDNLNKEMWVYIEDAAGNIVGASNFDVFAGNKTKGVDGTIHSTFTFVDPQHRGRNLMGALTQEREDAAKEFVYDTMIQNTEDVAKEFVKASGVPLSNADQVNLLTIIEQNSPLLMTPADLVADPMDAVTRRMIYAKRGFQQLDMRYIQPSVGNNDKGERVDACNVLDLCVKGTNGQPVPTEALQEHFDRWFRLSFPKGTTLNTNPTLSAEAAKQDKELQPMIQSLESAGDSIGLMPNSRYELLEASLDQQSISGLKAAGINAIEGTRVEDMEPGRVIREYMKVLAKDETLRDTPVGDIFPGIAMQYYGGHLAAHRDLLPQATAYSRMMSEQGLGRDMEFGSAEIASFGASQERQHVDNPQEWVMPGNTQIMASSQGIVKTPASQEPELVAHGRPLAF